MKKILILLIVFFAIILLSCTKEDELSELELIFKESKPELYSD